MLRRSLTAPIIPIAIGALMSVAILRGAVAEADGAPHMRDMPSTRPGLDDHAGKRGRLVHNGSAETVEDVVDFYESRFNVELISQERSELLAFLRTL